MTKWGRGSERMRLNALIVEVDGGVSSRLRDLHLPRCSPAFSSGPTGGMQLCHDRTEGVRDTLAGRQAQRQHAVNY